MTRSWWYPESMSVEREGHHENRLAGEASPYLRQHARNPVDWYPWGEEAFARAKREDKPVLLSIGYATCHWCHVMERESFEDEAIAAQMNANFVSIKVDREERPDIDDLYMQATLAMHGQGGWPMTVFLTPDQKPLFAGTYFPPTPRGGMPSFPQVLSHVAERWRRDRATLLQGAEELTRVLASAAALPLPASVGREAIRGLVAQLERSYDAAHGGFGSAPKFPPHPVLRLLLRLAAETNERGDGSMRAQARAMALGTLDGMARGGIRDHLGGGFARYATDAAWLVPHFEKMLFDNAQLAKLYAEAFQLTREGRYRRVAAETLDFMLGEMRDPSGAFVSAYDADSEGEEGTYYVFTYDEILEACAEHGVDGAAVARAFGATEAGNFEGKNVLHRPEPLEAVAETLGLEKYRLQELLGRGRRALLEARARREKPFLDDKVIAAWNGLAISALATGAEVLGEARYLEAATAAADAVFARLFDGTRLLRTYRGEVVGRGEGVLEDYALLAEASLDLFEARAEARHLERAVALAARIREAFRAPGEAGFASTSSDAEALVARRTDASDGALPSAQAVAARLLLRLSHHLGEPDLAEEAVASVRAHGRAVARAPRAFATLLEVASAALEGPVELVLAGAEDSDDTAALEGAIRGVFVPHRVLLRVRPGDPVRPLSEGRVPAAGDLARLYVCHGGTCGAPVVDPAGVESAVRAAVPPRARAPHARLRRSPVKGKATKAATAARLEARELPEGAVLGAGAVDASAEASGAVVVPRLVPNLSGVPDVEEMLAVVEASLEAGLCAFDLSGLTHPDSLEAAGEALASAIDRGLAPREAIVVSLGLDATLVEALLGDGAQPLHPATIERALTRALETLGLAQVDLVILEQADPGLDRASLAAAFAVLEAERAAGVVGRYGLAAASVPDDPEAWGARAVAAAEEAGGKAHGLSLLSLPVNLAEGLEAPRRLDRLARASSIALGSSSPLQARGPRALRLADAEPAPEAMDDTRTTGEALARAEADFERDLGSVLRLPDGRALGRFFDFAPLLSRIEAELEDPSAYAGLEAAAVAGPVEERLRALDRACGGHLREPWAQFKARYAAALDAHLDALRAKMSGRQAERVAPILAALDPYLPMALTKEPLAVKALHLLLAHPALDLAAVPVASAEEVGALARVFGLPAIRDANGAIDALIARSPGAA